MPDAATLAIDDAPPAPPAPRPLTEAQAGLWYFQSLDRDNPILNTSQYLDLRGPIARPALIRAVQQTLDETEALRLRFATTPEGPVQWLAEAPPRLRQVDLTGDPDAEAAALGMMAQDTARPLDLARNPVAAMTLFWLGPERALIYERVHHLAIDGYGMVLITNRVAERYAALTGTSTGTGTGTNTDTDTGTGTNTDRLTGPQPAPFPGLQRAFDDDTAYRASPRHSADRDWWHATLADLPDEVAGPAPGRAISGAGFLRDSRWLAPDLTAAIQARADALGIGWPDLLTALTGAYLARWTEDGRAVIGLPFMARLGRRSAGVPCMAMNVLPQIIAPDEAAPLADWLVATTADLREARRHGFYRSEVLRRELGRVGGTRRLYGPLVNVQPFDRPPVFPGLAVTLHIMGAGAVDDLTLTFRGDPEAGLLFELDANPALYAPVDVAGHAARLPDFLTRAVAAETLATVATASTAEVEAADAVARAAEHAVPHTTLAALIEAQMAATPTATALRFGAQTLSYGELDRRSAALAQALIAQGAGPGRIVAVALQRAMALPIALVAILRAGAAYLPLDTGHPPARLAQVIALAQPVVTLTSADLAPGLGLDCAPDPALDGKASAAPDMASDLTADPVPDLTAKAAPDLAPEPAMSPAGAPVLLTRDWPLSPTTTPLPPPGPTDPAYVIFTSGSTGAPKGVVIDHRAIVNRLLWMADAYGIDASDRILQKTPAAFDVSVWEFFLPLITGGQLAIAGHDAHKDPSRLADEIRAHAVTTLHFVPSMLQAFLAAPASAGLTLRRVFCSGEALPADLRDRFHARIAAQLHNLYGPTEAAVDVSYWPAGPDDLSDPVPIGWPVWNTRLQVLDRAMRPVPPGLAGDLYLGGVQLAQGYLGRVDLTAARFIADPDRPGQRLYATGDRARLRHDGAVEFMGRSDHQVKLRGLRIELGEIEAAIMATGLARETVVLAREDQPGQQRLVAYLVPADRYTPGAIAAGLARVLPDYMVPTAEVALPALPVTSNGKLDRKALPPPVVTATGRRAATATERVLAALFAEVLHLPDPPPVDADFFALGGDSLSAVRLILRIEEAVGRDPGLGTVFEHPRLAALAAALDRQAQTNDGLGPTILLAEGDADAAPLFLIHPAGGLAWGYRHLARLIAPSRSVWGIQHPGLDAAAPPPESIAQLAHSYRSRMRGIAPDGPLNVAGWSLGGIITQEVGAQEDAAGTPPGLIAALDAYPADAWRSQPDPDPVTALRALLAIAGHDPEAHTDLDTRAKVVAFLQRDDSALAALPPALLEGVIRTVTDTNRLIRAHHHRPLPGTLTHIRAARDHAGTDLDAAMWAPYADRIDALQVPFAHAQMTGPQASALIAPMLAARLV